MNKIELEYRSEIDPKSFANFHDKLAQRLTEVSHTKRLSYMGFTDSGENSIDLRARVTNGQAETVLKKGSWDASDRVEIPQPIDKNQLVGFAKIFSHIADRNFVSERETFNYESEDGIVVSLVKSTNIAYVEFELLSDESNMEENDAKVKGLMRELDVEPMSKEAFNDLNNRLEEHDDWEFSDNDEDVEKLTELLSKY